MPWLQVGRGFMAFSCRWVVGSWPLPRLHVGIGVMGVAKAAGGWWVMAVVKVAG